nr:hypothetical protein [Oscillospiraceae bacterium]
MKCIKCGREHSDYHFRVLQVQTLYVRDFGKDKRIQALGGFEEYDVCRTCTEEKYAAALDAGKAARKTLSLWGVVMAVGLILSAVYWNGEGVLRLAGLGALIGGGLCLIGGLQAATTRKRQISALSREDALAQCAWECMLDGAPSKNDINDITYIPVNEETLARKNGDLMILYELLPEIAIEAHKRIHSLAEKSETT